MPLRVRLAVRVSKYSSIYILKSCLVNGSISRLRSIYFNFRCGLCKAPLKHGECGWSKPCQILVYSISSISTLPLEENLEYLTILVWGEYLNTRVSRYSRVSGHILKNQTAPYRERGSEQMLRHSLCTAGNRSGLISNRPCSHLT
jgi:hypothetical protein